MPLSKAFILEHQEGPVGLLTVYMVLWMYCSLLCLWLTTLSLPSLLLLMNNYYLFTD